MASFAAACRLSSRFTIRQLRQENTSRSFRTSAACLATQDFTMPALSPTMTEGNISSWRVKEGDSFSAGDVLLEIETDKASMDVEAQDDGVLAKILQPDGAKGIKVGSRIGVLAESGDDLDSLEMPQEKTKSSEPSTSELSESQQAPPTYKSSEVATVDQPSKPKHGKPKKQMYPLLPSVEHLMHENGLDTSAIDKMTPSGPNGRILKGDVLAYLGLVSASYPTELSARIGKLSHLDLSNIKIALPPSTPSAPSAAPEPQPVVEHLEVVVSISMAAVIQVQKRVQSTLGVFMPLSTFIARATEFANDDLPRLALAKQSTDELYNQLLGLDKVSSSSSRGNFLPQITALPPTAVAAIPKSRAALTQRVDIIDILTGKKTLSKPKSSIASPLPSATTNIFSLTVPKWEEKRARVFLERVKSVLEGEPGRLIL